MRTIHLDTTVVAGKDQVSGLLGEETVILHTVDGIYYGLDPVGTVLWNLLRKPRSVQELRDRLLDEFEVEAERCERDVVALVQQLAEHRLVDLTGPSACDE